MLTANPQAATIAAATCKQQLDTIGIVAQSAAIIVDGIGLGAEIAAQALPPAAQQIAEAVAIGTQAGSIAAQAEIGRAHV